MNGSSWNLTLGSLAASVAVLALDGRASAAVTFQAVGGDLVVTIDAPLSFLITSPTTLSQLFLNFEDVYTTGNTESHGDIPSSGTSTITLAGGAVSDGLEAWSDLDMTSGLLDPTDFYATYYFVSPKSLQLGDVVTVNPGVITIVDFITRGGVVPDAPATSIHLFDESLTDLSAPLTVPEAPFSLLGGLGLLGLLRRRR